MGIFLSVDLFLFFVFWEAMLVPMYFLIGTWGYDRRIYAALKFFIYTAAGSALLLLGILSLAVLHANGTGSPLTFDLRTLMEWDGLDANTARWLFLAFGASFAIKVPLFPLHTWLPDAHVEAPHGRLGAPGRPAAQARRLRVPALLPHAVPPGVGRLRPADADAGHHRNPLRRGGGRDAARPEEAGGLLVGGPPRLRRARHLRLHHRRDPGRVVHHGQPRPDHRRPLPPRRCPLRPARTPARSTISAACGSRPPSWAVSSWPSRSPPSACPACRASSGEFLSLLGTFVVHRPYAILSAAGVILAAVYMLWAFQRVFTGEPSGENATFRDLDRVELATRVAAARPEPAPRPLPEAAAGTGRAVGQGADRPRRVPLRLRSRRRSTEVGPEGAGAAERSHD